MKHNPTQRAKGGIDGLRRTARPAQIGTAIMTHVASLSVLRRQSITGYDNPVTMVV